MSKESKLSKLIFASTAATCVGASTALATGLEQYDYLPVGAIAAASVVYVAKKQGETEE